MSTPGLEAFLARLYTEETALAAFLRAPAESALAAGLDPAEAAALAAADHVGLVMAAASFRAKQAQRKRRRGFRFRRWADACHTSLFTGPHRRRPRL